MTQMATILSSIEYHRKAAWCMHESIHCMLPLLIQSRATLSNARDYNSKGSDKDSQGILQILKRICEVYGIGGKIGRKKTTYKSLAHRRLFVTRT